MKAVLKMTVSDGATLEFEVRVELVKGEFRATIPSGQDLYVGVGDTYKASVNNLLYKMADITASELELPKLATGIKTGR